MPECPEKPCKHYCSVPKTTPSPPSPEQRPADLATEIIQVLHQELAAGLYDTHTVFTELALSQRFGVSRTPVREALLSLERDGLLTQRDRSFGLPHYSAKQMTDLFIVRQQLEPYATRRIIEIQPPEKIDAYVKWARAQLAGKDSPESYIPAHQEVRTALLQLCRNPFIRNAIEMFDHQTAFIRQKTLRQPHNLVLSIALTEKLLDALESHDADAAELAASESLKAAHEAILQLLHKNAALA